MKVLHNCPNFYEKLVMKLGHADKAQAFTFSPPHCNAVWDIEKVHKELCYALTGYRYVLVGEFDEKNRWHYHGVTVGIPDMVFKENNNLLGFFDFAGKPSIKWLEYCFKNIHNTMKILDTVEYCVFHPLDFRLKSFGILIIPEVAPQDDIRPAEEGRRPRRKVRRPILEELIDNIK